ncbi:uncharacterized protein LOC119377400 [Rhipicephalus sanguineus]|uniref:uncharacterized protein LOC119377400 n=1 Tax=Rhipicephalus sanguineus TaxID=34632 RepID=UPI0020C327D8|nr:uncharacterized protein LOC119377400 [Rhipicephalus sanguineus]
MTAPVQPILILLQQPGEPPTYRGSSCEDPESSLEAYDQVAVFNHWSNDDKLRPSPSKTPHGHVPSPLSGCPDTTAGAPALSRLPSPPDGTSGGDTTKWRRGENNAYVDVAAGDTARPALKKSLLLNALGVEGLDVYWTIQAAQEQAGSGDGTRDEGLHPNSSAPSPSLDPVRTRVFHKQQATKQRIDSKRGAKPPKLQVGLRVKVRLPGKQNKYRGPYTILSQTGFNSFRLSDGNVWNASKLVVVHAEQNATPQQNSCPPPNTSSMHQHNSSPPPCSSAVPQLVRLPLTTLQAPSQQSADVPSPNATLLEGGIDSSTNMPTTENLETLPRSLSDERIGEPQGSNSSTNRPLRPKRHRRKPSRYKDYVP